MCLCALCGEYINFYINPLKLKQNEKEHCSRKLENESVTPIVDKNIIGVGAENCADKASGAYTGEVSAEMVASTGAQYVILATQNAVLTITKPLKSWKKK